MATTTGIKKHCALCTNHGVQKAKKKHICDYESCKCYFCVLTRKCQKAMCHQQRVWRHKKQAFKKNNKGIEGQACDRCRNHGILVKKKNHNCPKADCTCIECNLNNIRKILVKHHQRVRRANVTSEKFVESIDENDASENAKILSLGIGESTASASVEAIQLPEKSTEKLPLKKRISKQAAVIYQTDDKIHTKRNNAERLSKPATNDVYLGHVGSPPPLIPISLYNPIKANRGEHNLNPHTAAGFSLSSYHSTPIKVDPDLRPTANCNGNDQNHLNSYDNNSYYVAAHQHLISKEQMSTEMFHRVSNNRYFPSLRQEGYVPYQIQHIEQQPSLFAGAKYGGSTIFQKRGSLEGPSVFHNLMSGPSRPFRTTTSFEDLSSLRHSLNYSPNK